MAKKNQRAVNPTAHFATLSAGDNEYRLVADFNWIAEAEMQTGVNILSSGLSFNNPTAIHVRAMLWAALRPTCPEITIAEAGNIIIDVMEADKVSLQEAIIKVVRALSDAYRVAQPEPGNPTGAGSAAEN